MFWDIVSPFYDLFGLLVSRRVYRELGDIIAREIQPCDTVLECACGTGAISVRTAPVCRHLFATDVSAGMRRQTRRKCRRFPNVTVRAADIEDLKLSSNSFDKVIAGNVIHLVKNPEKAVNELLRVCRHGGRVIIPTYINADTTASNAKIRILPRLLAAAGVRFESEFDAQSYPEFFRNIGCGSVRYEIVGGRFPCMAAIITKQ